MWHRNVHGDAGLLTVTLCGRDRCTQLESAKLSRADSVVLPLPDALIRHISVKERN